MKRGIIITIILVIIAVILAIVFINLFKERNTTEVANRVISVAEEGYLAEDNEDYKIIIEHLSSLSSNSRLETGDKNEVENFLNTLKSYSVIVSFYSKQIIYTDYNDIYSSNANSVLNNFNDAEEEAENLAKFIQENSAVWGDSEQANARAWSDISTYAVNIITATNNALTGLANIYAGCLGSKIANNDFANLVLSTINTKLSSVLENFGTSSDDSSIVYTMAVNYLDENYEDIMTYYSNVELQERVNSIIEGEEEYLDELFDGTICQFA